MRIILPDEVDKTEGLRKSLAALVKSPNEREYQRLVAEGFDSETAAHISGLDEMDESYRASVVLRNSDVESYVRGSHDVARTAQSAVMTSMTSVGSSAGAQVGSAISAALMRGVVRNAQTLSVAGTAIVGIGIAYASAKLVSGALGTSAAVAAAVGSTLTAGLIAVSLYKRMA